MKATVIIPLYNTEDYIERAILSAVGQDIDPSEMEILVVNDGSTDNSLAVAQELAQKYSQVKVFSKPNEGLSKTRNFAIDRASGDYIFFLDSDDYFFEGAVARAVEFMELDDLDLLGCDYSGIYENGEYVFNRHRLLKPTPVMSGRDYLLFKEHHKYHTQMVWTYVYRRSFLNENNLRMISFVHEDVDFSLRSLLMAKKMRYEPMKLLYYYQRSSSIMNSYKPQYTLDMIHILSNVDRFVKQNFSQDREIVRFFTKYISDSAFSAAKRSVKLGQGVEQEIINLSKEVGIYPFDNTDFSLKRALINLNPNLFFHIYGVFKSVKLK